MFVRVSVVMRMIMSVANIDISRSRRSVLHNNSSLPTALTALNDPNDTPQDISMSLEVLCTGTHSYSKYSQASRVGRDVTPVRILT